MDGTFDAIVRYLARRHDVEGRFTFGPKIDRKCKSPFGVRLT